MKNPAVYLGMILGAVIFPFVLFFLGVFSILNWLYVNVTTGIDMTFDFLGNQYCRFSRRNTR